VDDASEPAPPGINYPTFPTNPIVVPPGGTIRNRRTAAGGLAGAAS
jgi:hypothetical protein